MEEGETLRELDRDLWVIDHDFSVPGGIRIGTRTTLVRRADGRLLVIAPGELGVADREEIERCGSVAAILAPNNVHHLFLAECAKAFPDARVYATAGVVEKEKKLDLEVLRDAVPEGWESELDAISVPGIPMLDELVLLHRPSRTLILTDLCFNVQHSDSLITRLFMRVNSAYRRFGPSRLLRSQIRDKAALRGAIDRILEWDFDRVIVTHGDVLERGGPTALRESYAWLSG